MGRGLFKRPGQPAPTPAPPPPAPVTPPCEVPPHGWTYDQLAKRK
jgi:hypothetical protein